jgi:hypothetical protein
LQPSVTVFEQVGTDTFVAAFAGAAAVAGSAGAGAAAVSTAATTVWAAAGAVGICASAALPSASAGINSNDFMTFSFAVSWRRAWKPGSDIPAAGAKMMNHLLQVTLSFGHVPDISPSCGRP